MTLDFGLVTFKPRRRIGTFTSQVTFEESGSDELTITRHPVEQGAAITDHAFKEPAQLTIRAGWSPTVLQTLVSSAGALLSGASLTSLLSNDYVKETYEKLLKLQAEREPFEIVTGKRRYKNMLMRSLAQTTDEKTESVLVVTAQFQEIIIVQTQATSLPPADQQAEPERTAAPEANGSKQLNPAPAANQEALSVLDRLRALQGRVEG